MSASRRTGMVLLEVLVALAIVTSAGTALVGLLTGHLARARRDTRRESDTGAAHAVLVHHALYDRRGLEQRIGAHRDGQWLVQVSRPRPELFRVAISDTLHPDYEALVTLLYRATERP